MEVSPPGLSECLIELMQSERVELQEHLHNILPIFHDLAENTKLHTDEDPRVPMGTSTMDPQSIHFDVTNITPESRQTYSTKVTVDL